MNGRPWTDDEVSSLRNLFDRGIPDDDIAITLGRTKGSVKNTRRKKGITGDHNARRISEAAREKMGGEIKRGADSRSWKGGRIVNHNGYIQLFRPGHPRALGKGYVFEHILVAEQTIGRSLHDSECVHHIDRNKQNNTPENLLVLSKGEHTRLHTVDRCVPVMKKCCVCGSEFRTKASHFERRKTCSKKCYVHILAERCKKENPQWRRSTK